MATGDLFAAELSGSGVVPTCPLSKYCVIGQPGISGADMNLRMRMLAEDGSSLGETIVSVTTGWHQLLDLTSDPAFDEDTVALEMLYGDGGYFYYNMGADGTGLREDYFPDVATGLYNQKTSLLLAGDICGQGSYVRPIRSTLDEPGYVVRVLLESAADDPGDSVIAAGTEQTLPSGDPSVSYYAAFLQERASKLAVTLATTRYGGSGTVKVKWWWRFRSIRAGYGTQYYDSGGRKTPWTDWIFLHYTEYTAASLTEYLELDGLGAGWKQIQVLMQVLVGSTDLDNSPPIGDDPPPNYVAFDHEIW